MDVSSVWVTQRQATNHTAVTALPTTSGALSALCRQEMEVVHVSGGQTLLGSREFTGPVTLLLLLLPTESNFIIRAPAQKVQSQFFIHQTAKIHAMLN